MVKKHAKEQKAKKKSTTSPITYSILLLAVIIAVIVVFSVRTSEPARDYSTYNSFEFMKLETGWQTLVERDGQVYEAPFYNHPLDITNVSYDDNVTLLMLDVINTIRPERQFIIAIEEDAGSVPVLAGVNIAKITGRFYERQTRSAIFLPEGENTTVDLPVVNCETANFQNVVVKISPNQTETKVHFIDDYCIEIAGTDKDSLLMAADYVGYKMLGIMQ